MTIVSDRTAAIYGYRIDLNPAIRCAGTELNQRQGWLIRLQSLQSIGGAEGYGEVAPLPGFSHENLAEAQRDLITLAHDWLAGRPLSVVDSASARFGFSCALHELAQGPLQPTTDSTSLSSYPLLQDAPATLPAQIGITEPVIVKLKLARQPLALEIAQIKALLQQHPQLQLRIDCNRGWSLEQATEFVTSVPASAIDYLEEPCTELSHSLQLAELSGVRLALDETLRQSNFARQPSQLPIHPGIKALVIKPSLTGSIGQVKDWIELGQQRDLKTILSSSFESSLGLGQISALAACFTPEELPGLDTSAPFSANLLRRVDVGKPTLTMASLDCLWNS